MVRVCLFSHLTHIVVANGFIALIVGYQTIAWMRVLKCGYVQQIKPHVSKLLKCVCVFIRLRLLHNEYANLLCLSNKCGQTHVVCQRNHNHKSGPSISQVESGMFRAAQWTFQWFQRANSRNFSLVCVCDVNKITLQIAYSFTTPICCQQCILDKIKMDHIFVHFEYFCKPETRISGNQNQNKYSKQYNDHPICLWPSNTIE